MTSTITRNNKQQPFKNINFPFNDFVDENFIQVFGPLLLIQKVLGSCRVSVKDGVFGPPTILQKLYTVIWLFFTLYSNFRLVQTYFLVRIRCVPQVSVFVAGVVLVTLVFCTSIAHSVFADKNGSVKLYKKMQKIDRNLKIYKNDFIRSNHYKRNLVTVSTLATLFNMLIVLCVISNIGPRVTDIVGGMWIFQAFVFDLSCLSSHLSFFTSRVRLINAVMINFLETESRQIKTISKRCASFKRTLKRMNFETTPTDLYMREIFSGFQSVQERYKFQLACFTMTCIYFLVAPLIYIIFVVQAQKTTDLSYEYETLDFVFLGTINIIHVSILLTLCLRTEKYLREIRKTKRISIYIMSRYNHGPFWQKAKKMLKLLEDIPPSFTVYGMWHVDARLVLTLFNLVTGMLVTILQLAYQ